MSPHSLKSPIGRRQAPDFPQSGRGGPSHGHHTPTSGVADSPVILIALDGRPLAGIVTSRRHEGLHRELSKLEGGTKTTGILAEAAGFLDSSDAVRHAPRHCAMAAIPKKTWRTRFSCASAVVNGTRSAT